MKSLPNIEKSAFRRGEYVGYGGGTVWRITRAGDGRAWDVRATNGHNGLPFGSFRVARLIDASWRLAELKTPAAA